MYVRDLSGNEYACQATLTQDYELNGNQSLSATLLPSKANRLFIEDISEMWQITDFNDVIHRIVYAKKKGEGNLSSVEIKAIPLFFDTFDTERIYDEYSEHMTALKCFSLIFEDSGYDFALINSFEAVEWEGLGAGETRLEMFKRALERYKAEFRIAGNTVYLERQIGRDTQFQYRYRLNASNITQETDASEMWTYAKGYGDYDEGSDEDGNEGGWENAKLVREYTSPLAEIIGIRHAPPTKDGRVKSKETMDESLKQLVDESLKISISADIHDLRRQGYALAQPELGDRVFIIDERIGLVEEVRVVDISVTRNWRGEVIDFNLTFGGEGITKRYQSNLKTAVNDITSVMEGRKRIPFTALDKAAQQATLDLQSVQTEVQTPPSGGLLAVNKDNPNLVVLFNSAGIGISEDGGASFRTSMTGAGIVADTITTGTLYGITIISDDGEGGRVILDKGAIETFQDNTEVMSVDRTGLSMYNSSGIVGTLRASHKTYNPDLKGVNLMGEQDYVSIGFKEENSSNSKPILDSRRESRETVLTGSDDTRDNGLLLLKSTDTGGSANGSVPRLYIDNRTISGTAYSGARLYIGRDNRSPSSSNFRPSFEVWQYAGDGKGSTNLLLDIDTDSSGESYTDIRSDEAYLPNKSYLSSPEGYYYSALGFQTGHGRTSSNVFMYYQAFIAGGLGTNQRHNYTEYSFNLGGKIHAVFAQAYGSNSVYINTTVYNQSDTGFRVYFAKTDADDTREYNDIRVKIMVMYEA